MDRNTFTDAMRNVAHSVTVVTTDGPAGRHGATVSAFCSVSADPPMALVCLNSKSRISDMVLENRSFAVNVLPHNANHVADRFAGLHDAFIPDRFEGIDVDGPDLPIIDGATVFHCELDQSVPSGTHHIVIGHVHSVTHGTKQPLAYLDGAYHEVIALSAAS